MKTVGAATALGLVEGRPLYEQEDEGEEGEDEEGSGEDGIGKKGCQVQPYRVVEEGGQARECP